MATDIPLADSTELMVASRIIGYECADVNKSFLICKENNEHPTECFSQGEKVMGCVFGILRKLDRHCGKAYRNYKQAMEDRWHEVDKCREEQSEMEMCWKNLKHN